MSTARKYLTPKQKLEVLLRYDGRCAECRVKFDGKITPEFDHIHALGIAGTNDIDNFRPLCHGPGSCHAAKTLADVKAIAKGKRIRGETGNGLKKKIQSQGFQKTMRRKMDGSVVPRVGKARMA